MDNPKRLLNKTYIKLIRNSVGTKMFRNFYLRQNKNTFDATKDGELSCAFYVSSLLIIFSYLKNIHGTVDGTQKDLETSGWVKVSQPKIGNVIIWGPEDNNQDHNKHIGFYVGRKTAISNSTAKRKIVKHDWTYGGARKVLAIYENPN